MKKKSYLSSVLLLIAIFVVVAVISQQFFLRFDLTEGGQYSLSKASKDILSDLQSPVTVTAYFTADLPPDLAKVKRNFRDMLTEYNSLSHGNVVFKFVNPNGGQTLENEAVSAGVQPVLFKARDKDEMKQQKVFMGAVVSLNNKTEVIPFINPEGSIEYDLTTAIKKLSVENKPMIGFVQGQGEPPLQAYQQVLAELDVLYQVSPVTLSDTIDDINKYSTLVISSPTDTFNVEALRVMDKYLNNGGNLFIAFNAVTGNLQTLSGEKVKTNLADWLAQKGIQVENSLVLDANCGNVNVSQQMGAFNMTTPVKFPYLPLVSNFTDMAITRGLEQVMLGFPSPITFGGDTAINFVPLAITSENSGVQPLPLVINVQKNWTRDDFKAGEQVVAALFEGNFGNRPARIVLVTSGDLAVNGTGQRPRQLQPDNVSLMVNAIDWMSDATGLIELRTKTITSRPLDQLTDGQKATIKWGNFVLPMALVIVYGVLRWQWRRKQRTKRMEEGYVK
ncbi:MAG: GldG family protein [Bacteroidetes bacterium]|nr:GldG family protein [Bacteroidota bacterium]